MNVDLRRAMTWPLRPLGLEPGHALSNARPSAEQVRVARDELRASIAARCEEYARRDGMPAARRSL